MDLRDAYALVPYWQILVLLRDTAVKPSTKRRACLITAGAFPPSPPNMCVISCIEVKCALLCNSCGSHRRRVSVNVPHSVNMSCRLSDSGIMRVWILLFSMQCDAASALIIFLGDPSHEGILVPALRASTAVLLCDMLHVAPAYALKQAMAASPVGFVSVGKKPSCTACALGELKQQGTVSVKYGTKSDLVALCRIIWMCQNLAPTSLDYSLPFWFGNDATGFILLEASNLDCTEAFPDIGSDGRTAVRT
ncbi:uncharacterized protein FOMMEDRAFT_150827 [Fomitiporia mediterranea MF3/22]|uniref:uncharacterized protein n=1 Tax=Fomitiporia mediterranea (strain MF3/22) TaxID=694068 RepID=UPI000440997F|nr:uncharacterized protein FOMMEDRAFT_150827 [Fomitiporia mediterranea MF3/22]EJD08134.1 hypothetical protein FOMMEDRAFT_150827 [Fomitiporia mediterranea MF3/22]